MFMNVMHTAAVAMLAALAAAAPAQDRTETTGIAGRWTMTVDAGAHGTVTMQLALKQDGSKVTGTFSNPHGETPVEGEFSAATLKLKTSGEPAVTFEARLDADGRLAGYMSSEMGDMKWSAERVKDQVDARW